MLIEFQVENFRSFRERETLSMVAAHFSEHESTNTFDPGIKGFERFVRSAVIYGPNAAGKTNLLRAVQFVQNMVLHSATNAAAGNYPYDPFKLSSKTRNAPSEFEITFAHDGVRYVYGFSMGPERIEKEWLVEHVHTRGRTLFERSYVKKKKDYDWKFSTYLKGQKSTWSEATRPDALFLSTSIQLNSKQLIPIYEWFQKRLVVIVGPTKLNESLTLKLLDEPDGKERLLPFLREADLNVADVKIEREPVPPGGQVVGKNLILERRAGANTPDAVSVSLSHETDDPENSMEFEFADESHGTQIIFKTAGAWLNVIANGEVILVDEIDASLHPLLVRYLIKRFHSNSKNPKNAQLICSTHNTSLLDRELFRRDQVWFIEKEQDGSSKLYPLTDFRPRNDEHFERAYMRGRYGALPILNSNGE